MAVAYSMKKKMAKGGKVQWGQIEKEPGINAKGVHKSYGKTGTSDAGILIGAAKKMHDKNPDKKKYVELAKHSHKEVLKELKEDKTDRKNLAEGGAVGCPNCGYFDGGEIPDELPNEFDYMELEPAPKASVLKKRK